jgi:hypothetical protein
LQTSASVMGDDGILIGLGWKVLLEVPRACPIQRFGPRTERAALNRNNL